MFSVRPVALLIVGIALTACNPATTDTTPAPTVPEITTTTTATTTTTLPEGPDCLAGNLPFAEHGIVAALDSPQHDATTIGGIRWQPDEACERILIEFLTEGGSPATRLGPVGVTLASDTGIVRVTLPEAVVATAIGDSLLSGSLVDHVYVVEGITEDALVVDLHLAARAAARAFTTNSPSRLVIDVRPTSDVPIGSAPESSDRIVVSSPLPGPSLYPLQVAGYAAPGVDAVRVTVSTDGRTAVERSVSTITENHLWRAFAVTITDGPSGPVQVRVVPESGGEDEGVVVDLDLP